MDLIDKNMAIDICNSAIDLWHGQLGEGALVAVKEGIEGLPSVEPEPINPCTICQEFDCTGCKFRRT